MSIIAVKGVPSIYGLMDVVKCVGKVIAGPFEPLNFAGFKGPYKTCYLRLSERLDPVRVVDNINQASFGSAKKPLKFEAYVPEEVPDLPLADKRKKIPMKLRDKLKIPELELPHEVIVNTHHELFLEIQYKYPGLYNLSKKTSHKLLDEIARIIGDRLKDVMEANPTETRDSCFHLSRIYRRTHPHFGDFQLILSTLHGLQDAAGAPRAQINEADLLAIADNQPMIGNIPLDQIRKASNKFSDRVSAAVHQHITTLDAAVRDTDNEEEIARKRVREELKKMAPYLPAALKQVMVGQFVPEEPPHKRIRIYGEPFLPNRDAMTPFTRRFTAGNTRIIRHRRMYNLITFRVPHQNYAQLRAMDATVINGAKLTIRTDIPIHAASDAVRGDLAAYFGGTPQNLPAHDTDDDDDDEDMDHEHEYE